MSARRRIWRVVIGTSAAMVFIPTSWSWSDMPPPPDYVETCTMNNLIWEERTLCRGGVLRSAECTALKRKGYKGQCKTYGASVWTEIWCKQDVLAKDLSRECLKSIELENARYQRQKESLERVTDIVDKEEDLRMIEESHDFKLWNIGKKQCHRTRPPKSRQK